MQRFRSRVSVLLLFFILVTVLPILFLDEPSGEAWIAYTVLGVSIGLVLLILFVVRYEVGKNYLIIKIGSIPYSRIKLDEITLIERTYNPLSAPASSLKRLYVKSKKKDALISPADEQEFVQLLKSRNPSITINISDKDDWWRLWDWDI